MVTVALPQGKREEILFSSLHWENLVGLPEVNSQMYGDLPKTGPPPVFDFMLVHGEPPATRR